MKLKNKIAITGLASFSALGSDAKTIWENYQLPTHGFQKIINADKEVYVAPLSAEDKLFLNEIRASDHKYKPLDDTVIFALAVSRKAVAQAKWATGDIFGVNFGSSRGATALFEKEHARQLYIPY